MAKGKVGTTKGHYNASTLPTVDITTNNAVLLQKAYTPKTNRILVFASAKLYISTQGMGELNVSCGSEQYRIVWINGDASGAGYNNASGIHVFDVVPGMEYPIVLSAGIDSGCKIMSYNAIHLDIIDI